MGLGTGTGDYLPLPPAVKLRAAAVSRFGERVVAWMAARQERRRFERELEREFEREVETQSGRNRPRESARGRARGRARSCERDRARGRERHRETQFERNRDRDFEMQFERSSEREVERSFESNRERHSERSCERVSQTGEEGRGVCAFWRKSCLESLRTGIHTVTKKKSGAGQEAGATTGGVAMVVTRARDWALAEAVAGAVALTAA